MAKLTLTDITSGFGTASKINTNNAAIEAALENTLSRDGTSPNAMEANLDMNGYSIINVAGIASDDESIVTDLTVSETLRIENVNGTDYMETIHDGTNLLTTFANTGKWDVTVTEFEINGILDMNGAADFSSTLAAASISTTGAIVAGTTLSATTTLAVGTTSAFTGVATFSATNTVFTNAASTSISLTDTGATAGLRTYFIVVDNGQFSIRSDDGSENPLTIVQNSSGEITETLLFADAISINGTTSVILTSGLQDFADDAAAAAGSIAVNQLYRTGSAVKIRVA